MSCPALILFQATGSFSGCGIEVGTAFSDIIRVLKGTLEPSYQTW